MRNFVYMFAALSGLNLLFAFSSAGLWAWEGDGRYGWLALIALVACVLSALLAAGFAGVGEKEKTP